MPYADNSYFQNTNNANDAKSTAAVPVPTAAVPSPTKSPVTVVGANWCGFTTRQITAIQKSDVPYQYIDCATDKTNPMCSDVRGFPTFKTSDNTVCHMGYTEDFDALKSKCIK